MIYFIP